MSGIRTTIDYLVIASLGLVALQVYLTTNKVWKRKHERAVAESISILGEFVGLVPVTLLTVKFTLDGQWEGMVDGLLWLVAATIAVLIGTGRWVAGRRHLGFFRLLRDALQLERGEVGHLAKSFLRPSGARRILHMLARMALVDDHLDVRERAFVESFARSWGIDFDWEEVPAMQGDSPPDFLPLRRELEEYLATSPPAAQVRQLGDVMRTLVGIDGVVTPQEALMLSELDGMMAAYLDAEERGASQYAVAIVPQSAEQDQAIAAVLPDMPKRRLHGGEVYYAGTYHSFDFAELVSTQYRALSFFVAVVRLADDEIADGTAAVPTVSAGA
jgi:hypothetical protein